MVKKRSYFILFICFPMVWMLGCTYHPKDFQEPKLVVATTGMIGDALSNILPKTYRIHTLMGAGVDPHTYEAKPLDIQNLAKAETIVYNGLHLEGKMTKLFGKLQKEKQVISISSGMPENKLIKLSGSLHDPHIWLDPFLWAAGIHELGDKLANDFPEDKQEILKRTFEYETQIRELGVQMQGNLSKIPAKKRILITSHDAFQYFGKAFQIKVEALQGISTVSEPGINQVSRLKELIIRNKIPSVFVESSVAKKSIQALKEACRRENYNISEGGTLFSDALGDQSQQADTYLKMLKRNTETLVNGLTKKR